MTIVDLWPSHALLGRTGHLQLEKWLGGKFWPVTNRLEGSCLEGIALPQRRRFGMP